MTALDDTIAALIAQKGQPQPMGPPQGYQNFIQPNPIPRPAPMPPARGGMPSFDPMDRQPVFNPPPRQGGSADGGMGPMMSVHPQHLQQMAGDVIPLPIKPGPNAGPPASGSPIMDTYRAGKPGNVEFMPPELYTKQIMNILKR
jgi:hypothetical protein